MACRENAEDADAASGLGADRCGDLQKLKQAAEKIGWAKMLRCMSVRDGATFFSFLYGC